jgi:hypothetical protein
LKIPLRSNCFFGISQVVRWYIFKQKAQFGLFLEGLRIENVGIIYGHLVYFTAIWYILWPFGNLLVIFSRFGILCQEKSGNPVSDSKLPGQVQPACQIELRPGRVLLQGPLSRVPQQEQSDQVKHSVDIF